MVPGAPTTEMALGVALSVHPAAVSFATALAHTCMRYMGARIALLSLPAHPEAERCASWEHMFATIGQYGRKSFGLDAFAGRVPLAAIPAVFAGKGNIRETMNHSFKCFAAIIARDLCGPGMLQEDTSKWILDSAGFNTAYVRETLARALATSGKPSLRLLDPNFDWVKCPWSPTVQRHLAMRVQTRQYGDPQIWTHQSKADFAALGGRLSAVEQGLVNPVSDAYLPWMDPRVMFSVNYAHPFVEDALARGWPMLSGISGMTVQYLEWARMAGLEGWYKRARLALLGYLLPINAHTFHEVMSAAQETRPDVFTYDGSHRWLSLDTLLQDLGDEGRGCT